MTFIKRVLDQKSSIAIIDLDTNTDSMLYSKEVMKFVVFSK